MIETWKCTINAKVNPFLWIMLMLLVTACGGGGGGGSSTPPTKKHEEVVTEPTGFEIELSVESSHYEFKDEPDSFIVELDVGDVDVNSIGTSSLQASNANVDFLNPRGDGVYYFYVTPDGTGNDIDLSILAGKIKSSENDSNKASSSLTVVGRDTISPVVVLTSAITSYGEDFAIDTIDLQIELSEDITGFKKQYLNLNQLEILEFEVLSWREISVTLRATDKEGELRISIDEATFSDVSGNNNIASNVVTFPAGPNSPEKVESYEVTSSIKQLTFSWDIPRNTSHFELWYRDNENSQWEMVESHIPSSTSPSATVDLFSLYRAVRSQYRINACNIASCSDGEILLVQPYLWNSVGFFQAPQAIAGQAFGSEVALSGDGKTLAVAAVNDASSEASFDAEYNDDYYRSGAVYLYKKTDLAWVLKEILKAPNFDRDDAFGNGLSINFDGSVLAIGADAEDGVGADKYSNSSSNSGAVYVYRFAEERWEFTDYLKSSTTNASDYFGGSVSLTDDGNTLVVGARGKESHESLEFSGAFYVFEYDGENWVESEYVKPAREGERFFFAQKVEISKDGTTIVAGSPGETSELNPDISTGAAYIYNKIDGAWSLINRLVPETNQHRQLYGIELSLSENGETIVIGSSSENGYNDNFESIEVVGAVYVYGESGGVYSLSQKLRPINPVFFINFGETVEVSADGSTLIIGASEYSQLETGFHTAPSPNDNRPLSTNSNYIYKLNNGRWEFDVFYKGFGGEPRIIASDKNAETIVVGSYGTNRLIGGINAIQDVDFDTESRETFTGAIFIY